MGHPVGSSYGAMEESIVTKRGNGLEISASKDIRYIVVAAKGKTLIQKQENRGRPKCLGMRQKGEEGGKYILVV